MATLKQLTIGSVVNYYNGVTADDNNFAVLRHYEDQFGEWTEVLNISTLEKDLFMSHTKIENFWTIVKEN